MATIDELISRAETIRDETAEDANTADRVGSWEVDMAKYVKANQPTKTSLVQTIGLATQTNNGLMSKEQVAQLKELEDMYKTDDDNYDFILTAFTTIDANPEHIGSHTIQYNSTGSARYKLKTKATSYESVAKTSNQYISLLTSSQNDIVQLCVSDVSRIAVSPSDIITMIQLSSKNQMTLNILDISNTKFTYLDLSGMYDVRTLKGINCNIARLGMVSVVMISEIDLSNSSKLNLLNVQGKNLKSLNVSNCSLLTTLYFYSNLAELTTINISGTGLNLDFVTNLASSWTSRSGKNTGVLTLNTALYNQMSSELRTTFTNKNITFDIK